jgi:anti-sigma regulatory factor (Ser/Thr protein kinase)
MHTPGLGAGCVGVARRFTIATLRRWEVADRDDDIVTVVSELVTNAWLHAAPTPAGALPRRAIKLGLMQPGKAVVCAVADPSTHPPAPGQPDDWAEGGRGLQVVSALSDTWGFTTPGPAGKIVWAMFATASAGSQVTRPA